MRWTLLPSLFCFVITQAAGAAEEEPPLLLPPLKLSSDHSWRGPVSEDGRIAGFDSSGHTQRLPNTPDFLRLVPAQPLAHGAFFSTKPIKAKEWVVEIGFRVHGQSTAQGKYGGRGLAFWAQKSGNPTATTFPGDPRKAIKSPPPLQPARNDPTDSQVSFFGNAQTFEGLGIIFDSSASLSVHPRSDPSGWSTGGADNIGVVSGLLDDSKGNFLETVGTRPADQAEAIYLKSSLGECEAGFRNSPGLVWVRIAQVNKQIRVDMDLTPHTSLSTAQRAFTHHCFTIEDAGVPSGYHLGMTALASSVAEPDAVDVYAFETWEVEQIGGADEYSHKVSAESRLAEPVPLAGTSNDQAALTASGVALEIFTSQAKIMEAVDALARRVEDLTGEVSKSGGTGLLGRLASIERRLTQLTGTEPQTANSGQLSTGQSPGPEAAERDKQGINYLANMMHGIGADMKSFGSRLDATAGRAAGNLATIQTRIGETFSLLHKLSVTVENQMVNQAQRDALSGSSWTRYVLLLIIFLVGLAFLLVIVRLLGGVGKRNGAQDGLLGSLGSGAGIGRRGGKKLI